MAHTLHRKKRQTKSAPRSVKTILAAFLGCLILCGVVFVVVNAFSGSRKPETPPPPVADYAEDSSASTLELAQETAHLSASDMGPTEMALDSALYAALAKLGAPKDKLRIRKVGKIEGLGGELVEVTAWISRTFPMATANHTVQSAWKSAGGEILDCVETRLGKQVVIETGFGGIVTRKIIIKRELSDIPLKGTVALMIDDFGIHPLDDVKGFLDLGIPFTATVIPFEKYTNEVGRALSENGIEIMVHMPMEPESYPKEDPGKHAIYVNLSPDEIKKRVTEAIASVGPAAVGMNNHMGSKATADKRTMAAFADALYESGLFFVDSRTSIYSCAEQEVEKRGIPTTHQDGNIDVESDTSFIAARFIELALKSRESPDGMLIVGHAQKNTLIAIKRVLPSLEEWEIEFITVSELIARRQGR